MTLENIIQKTKSFGRKALLAPLLISSLSFVGCSQKVNVTTPSDITIDIKHVGMIKGRVISPEIENNQVVFNGLENAFVYLLNTEFETKTVSDGFYSIDNIPAGSYSVRSCYNCYSSAPNDTKPVTVIKQQVANVEDLNLIAYPILRGKIFQTDKTTPFANKRITLIGSNTGDAFLWELMGSTTTSPDGSYAIDREDNWGNIKKFFQVKTDGHNVLFKDTDQSQEFIPEDYNIVSKDLYTKPK